MSIKNYEQLSKVLNDAFEQAAKGKGRDRHAQDLPFEQQPMRKIVDLVGVGFALGQAIKKSQESMRLNPDAAYAELLGAINYLAGAALYYRDQANGKVPNSINTGHCTSDNPDKNGGTTQAETVVMGTDKRRILDSPFKANQ